MKIFDREKVFIKGSTFVGSLCYSCDDCFFYRKSTILGFCIPQQMPFNCWETNDFPIHRLIFTKQDY